MTGGSIHRWLSEFKQQALTHIANRSFKRQPGWLDRMAMRLIAATADRVEADPEMEIPAYTPPEHKN